MHNGLQARHTEESSSHGTFTMGKFALIGLPAEEHQQALTRSKPAIGPCQSLSRTAFEGRRVTSL